MKQVERVNNQAWISFKEQLDQVLEIKGEFYSQPDTFVSVGEEYLFGNRRHFCLEHGNSSLFLSYPYAQISEMASRLITMSIKQEWERRLGYIERSKEMIMQKVLLGLYGDNEVMFLNQMGYSENGNYLTMVVHIRNQMNADDLNFAEDGLSSYFGFSVPLIKSGEYYACFLPVSHLPLDELADTPDWNEVGQGIYEMFVAELKLETCMAFFYPGQGIRSWGTSLRSAVRVLKVGTDMYPERRIFFSWEMTLETLLYLVPKDASQPYQISILGNWGTENMNQEWFHLVKTLIQENLNISETARKMFVHRNTIMYRLEKFKTETGRDLRVMEDAIQVYLAILLNRTEIGH